MSIFNPRPFFFASMRWISSASLHLWPTRWKRCAAFCSSPARSAPVWTSTVCIPAVWSCEYPQSTPHGRSNFMRGCWNKGSSWHRISIPIKEKVACVCASTQYDHFPLTNKFAFFYSGADDLLLLFTHIIIKARVPHLHSHVQFIEDFMLDGQRGRWLF